MLVRILVIFGIGLLGLIPATILYKHFITTKMIDYFLMGTGFLITVFQAIVIILIDTTEDTLLLFQINDALYPTFILMFLIHGARLRWDRTPNLIKLLSTIWYGSLIAAVFFYRIVELPSEANVLFVNMKNSSVRTEGQMLIINDIYIIGRGFEFYAHAFRLFSISIILYSYIRAKEFVNEVKINRSQNIFILAILSAAIFPIGMMGQMLFLWSDAQYFIDLHVFDLLTFVGISYIAIKYPETMLLSKTQIIRVYNIQQEYFATNFYNMPAEEMMENIQKYMVFLKNLYPELISN